jgi:hypothetical protein
MAAMMGWMACVAEGEGFDEFLFGDLVGGTLDHEHVLGVADVDEVERAGGHLVDGSGWRRTGRRSSATRTQAMGPFQGMSEMARAAEAPLTIGMSASWSWSAERSWPMSWTSLRKPSGKRGRQGRSQRREVRISLLGRATFAFEITTGEAAGSGVLVAVVDGEGEEVLAGLADGLGDAGGDDDVGLADIDVDGAARELRR